MVLCERFRGVLYCWALQEAIEAFGQLPDAQYSTGWVLCCIGRAYYENVDYLKAAEVFKWARQYDPARLQVHPCQSR